MIRAVLALLLAGALLALYLRNRRAGLTATLVYLLVMGGLRRWLIPLLGYQANDPLVLVGAVVAGVVFVREMQLPTTPATTLSKMVLGLLGIMILQMLNPLQGGLLVGVSAAFYYIVPLLWFFIGRNVGDGPLLRLLLRAFAGVSVAAGLYSLYQTYFGFTEGEMAWVNAANFVALNVGRIRPFSFLTSPAELSAVLSSSVVILCAAALCGYRQMLLLVPLLATALFFISARGAVITGIGAICVLWAMRSSQQRWWLIRVGMAVAVAVALVSWGLSHLSDNLPEDERIRPLVEHQVEGLSDPFGEKSTGGGHVSMVLKGIWLGIKAPWGHGLGATASGGKFGGARLGTEGDVSNMFVSLGLVGGVLYCCILASGLRTVVQLWRGTRSWVVLALLGVLLQQFLNWLNGGQYATVMFIWLSLGTLDRLHARMMAQLRAASAAHTSGLQKLAPALA